MFEYLVSEEGFPFLLQGAGYTLLLIMAMLSFPINPLGAGLFLYGLLTFINLIVSISESNYWYLFAIAMPLAALVFTLVALSLAAGTIMGYCRARAMVWEFFWPGDLEIKKQASLKHHRRIKVKKVSEIEAVEMTKKIHRIFPSKKNIKRFNFIRLIPTMEELDEGKPKWVSACGSFDSQFTISEFLQSDKISKTEQDGRYRLTPI